MNISMENLFSYRYKMNIEIGSFFFHISNDLEIFPNFLSRKGESPESDFLQEPFALFTFSTSFVDRCWYTTRVSDDIDTETSKLSVLEFIVIEFPFGIKWLTIGQPRLVIIPIRLKENLKGICLQTNFYSGKSHLFMVLD